MFGNVGARETSADEGGALGPFITEGCRLSDAEIRAALTNSSISACWCGAELWLEEVECWRGYTRADYLGATRSSLAVIEIKSDCDSLRRFDEQVRIYSAVADHVTLIVGWKLAADALRAAPSWWSVVLAEREETRGVRFVRLRDGAANPCVSASALAAMLPVAEVRRLARNAGLASNVPAHELREIAAAHVSNSEIRMSIHDWLARLSGQRAERTKRLNRPTA